MEGGKLKAAMNTKASKEFHEKWVKMIQQSGPKNWSTYTWYQVGTDLGAGASGMIFDADILGYFMNGGENKEKGQSGLCGLCGQSGCESADAECSDLVARALELLQAEGCRLAIHAVGRVHGA